MSEHKYVYLRRTGKRRWRFRFQGGHSRQFETLEEAVKYRDKYLGERGFMKYLSDDPPRI